MLKYLHCGGWCSIIAGTNNINTYNMNTLNKFAAQHNLQVVRITYKSYGQKLFGWDIINPETKEVYYSLEPCYYTNGDRWKVTGKNQKDLHFIDYFKSINSKMIELFNNTVSIPNNNFYLNKLSN